VGPRGKKKSWQNERHLAENRRRRKNSIGLWLMERGNLITLVVEANTAVCFWRKLKLFGIEEKHFSEAHYFYVKITLNQETAYQ